MRFDLGIKCTNPRLSTIFPNPSRPALTFRIHALHSSLITRNRIGSVLPSAAVTKIAKPIINLVEITMVQLRLPCSGFQKPHEPMFQDAATINRYFSIAVIANKASNRSGA